MHKSFYGFSLIRNTHFTRSHHLIALWSLKSGMYSVGDTQLSHLTSLIYFTNIPHLRVVNGS
jgi:hypothetical protein